MRAALGVSVAILGRGIAITGGGARRVGGGRDESRGAGGGEEAVAIWGQHVAAACRDMADIATWGCVGAVMWRTCCAVTTRVGCCDIRWISRHVGCRNASEDAQCAAYRDIRPIL